MRLPLLRRGLRWMDRHLAVAVLLLALLVGVGVPAAQWWEGRVRQDRIDAAAVERRGQICDALRASQQTDRALIDTVLDTEGGPSLLEPESFAALPPEVRTYIRELASQVPEGPGQSLAERLTTFRDERLGLDDLPAFCLEVL